MSQSGTDDLCSLGEFREWLASLVVQIPPGAVATYGTLATALGDTRAARAVAEQVSCLDPEIPVHRVVDRHGGVQPHAGALLAREVIDLECGRVNPSTRRVEEFETAFPLHRLRAAQHDLAARVILEGASYGDTVTGIDVAYVGDVAASAAVTMLVDTHEVVEEQIMWAAPGLPYIPTYLGFRELPVIRAVVEALRVPPDVLMIDGNGVLHPSGLGSASHIGVALGVPSIGVAKRLLCGRLEGGNPVAAIKDGNRLLGWAVWARANLRNPVYVSPGHLVSMRSALTITRGFLRTRIPEPIRYADSLARRAVRRRRIRDERGS